VLSLTSASIISIAPGRAWALDLGSLTTAQGQTLLLLTRHILPHDTLDDAVYALVVKELDAVAADPTIAALLIGGISNLDTAAGGRWLDQTSVRQLGVVESIAGDPFFEKVRSTAVVSLYNNELAFAHFGYEGSSFERGGYLNRGFDDLTWLPSPPETASPQP
jgi:hypothetical protein